MMVGKLIISFWGGLFSGTMLVLGCVFLIIPPTSCHATGGFFSEDAIPNLQRMLSKHGKMIEVDAVLFFLELHLACI